MNIYIYDRITHEYKGMEEAFVEPVGRTHVRTVYSTFERPLDAADVPAGKVQVFDEQLKEWVLTVDYRGKLAIDTNKNNTIAEIGEIGPLPTGWVLISPEYEQEYKENPDHFKIVDRELQKKTPQEIAQIDINDKKYKKRQERNAMLDDLDWRIQRAEDAENLGLECPDDLESLLMYRQFLRDFTLQLGWWNLKIETFEEYIAKGDE